MGDGGTAGVTLPIKVVVPRGDAGVDDDNADPRAGETEFLPHECGARCCTCALQRCERRSIGYHPAHARIRRERFKALVVDVHHLAYAGRKLTARDGTLNTNGSFAAWLELDDHP